MMTKRLCLLICCCLALFACKQEQEVPEHIQQQRQREQRQREQQRRQQAEAKKRGEAPPAGPSMWSAEVRRAVLQIYKARGMEAARSIQTLAHLGPTSAAALRHIAGSGSMHQRKQVLASLVLVELQMFRPTQLAELCKAHELPFAQQAAIEALGRLGNPAAERMLRELTPVLVKKPDPAQSNRPLRPMAQVLHAAKDRSRKWWYSDQQLAVLDRIHQADTPQKLQLAMAAVTDRSLDKGLKALLGSPAVRPPVKGAVAHKYIELAKDNPRTLRAHCAKDQPSLLRLAAAKRLLELGGKSDRAFIQQLSQAAGDRLAPVLVQMLSKR